MHNTIMIRYYIVKCYHQKMQNYLTRQDAKLLHHHCERCFIKQKMIEKTIGLGKPVDLIQITK